MTQATLINSPTAGPAPAPDRPARDRAAEDADGRDELSHCGTDVGPLRLIVVSLVVLVIFAALIGRLVYVQSVGQVWYAQQAAQQRLLVEQIQARPGDLVDRNGRLLATSVRTRSLFVDPSRLQQPWQTSLALADALDLDADALFIRLTREPDRRFEWIKRRLNDDEVRRVKQLQLPPEVWGFREEFLRQYPQGQLAAHVLGLRDIDGNGRGGVEQTMDTLVRGRDGRRVLERDALGRVLAVRDEIARFPQHGRTIQLTLDSVIQLHVERELLRLADQWRPQAACAIVMDPRSGDILAMGSYPGFNPNEPHDVAAPAWRNHAIASLFEPGSTLKPFIVASALDQHLIDREERFYCEQGRYRMGRRLLHDHHSYGWLNVKDILVKSSNIGMAKIGERMTNARLYDCLRDFGFAAPTRIQLAGELPGKLRPLDQWNGYSTGSIPMGQELAVTPLQLITAHCALANEGVLIRPRLVLNGGTQDEVGPRVTRRCVSRETAAWIVQTAMRQVVEQGTGKLAQLEGVSVFGKTGTAQKVDPATGQYSKTKHICSFVAGAPAESPRCLVLVVVDEPQGAGPLYGGTVAAPSSREILRLAMRRIPRE